MATIFTGTMSVEANGTPRPGRAPRPARVAAVRGQVEAGAVDVQCFEHAAAVLVALQSALLEILAALPGRLERSTDLQRLLGTDPKLAWQVFKFAHAPAALPASGSLPGAVAMRRVFALSIKKGVPEPAADAGRAAFDAFDRFVTDRAGDRRSFNTMAGGGRNDGQATNLAHKKAAFRAAAHFMGVQTDVIALTFLIHPSATTPGRWDLATLVYKLGIRRLRPDARIMLAHVGKSGVKAGEDAANCFEPIEPDVDPGFVATILPPFCSNATADTVIKHEKDEYVSMEVAEGSLGNAGATDWAFGVVERSIDLMVRPGERLKSCADISTAVSTLVIDVFVSADYGGEPSSNVMTYVQAKAPRSGDGASDHVRLNLNETVVAMGRGDAAARRSEITRYGDFIAYACDRLGWEPSKFRAYRCRVEYPVLGTSLDLHFDYPK